MDQILCNIHKELNRQGKTQKDLCDFLGMTESNFSLWNSGKNHSYKKKLPLIADFFGITQEQLLTGNASEAEAFYLKFKSLSKNSQDTILYIMEKESE